MSEKPEQQSTEQPTGQTQQPPQRKLSFVYWILLIFGLLAAYSIAMVKPLELVADLAIIAIALWLILARHSPLRLLPNVHQVACAITIFIAFLVGSWIATIYAIGPLERLHPQTPWLYLACFGFAFAYFGIPLHEQTPTAVEEETPSPVPTPQSPAQTKRRKKNHQ